MFSRCVFVFLSAGLAVASAQLTNGSISGRLVDTQGAVLTQGKITLKNQERDLTQTQSTDGAGNFIFPSLPPGTYELTFTAPGFKTLDRKDVVLLVN
ncbi:MAG: carboxypeptidase-like regulatory domain-containing protein [Bryobacteraceae bacterium]|nr:carboxypeptidase-like regulatory domain-containing protein [Bryobacteraceae bacterium]MDW8380125.1 carboxypeptidase-like regulatory domain-containing protein [Bryobacterales bacterium]